MGGVGGWRWNRKKTIDTSSLHLHQERIKNVVCSMNSSVQLLLCCRDNKAQTIYILPAISNTVNLCHGLLVYTSESAAKDSCLKL